MALKRMGRTLAYVNIEGPDYVTEDVFLEVAYGNEKACLSFRAEEEGYEVNIWIHDKEWLQFLGEHLLAAARGEGHEIRGKAVKP